MRWGEKRLPRLSLAWPSQQRWWPPLCVVGYGHGSYRTEIAYGASLLFLTNLASIVLAGAFMFFLLGFRPIRNKQSGVVRRGFIYSTIGISIIMVPLAISSISIVQEARRESTVRTILADEIDSNIADIEDIELRPTEDGYEIAFKAYVYQSGQANADLLDEIQQRISTAIGEEVTLRTQVLTIFLATVDEEGVSIIHADAE